MHEEFGDGSDELGGPIGSGVGIMMEVNVTEQSSESQAKVAVD
jgi:hypothetical protein